MKMNKTLLIITTILCLLPCLMGLVMWSSLPESIPTHWNVGGEIDRYMPKAAAVFAIPTFLAVLHVVGQIKTGKDKQGKNYSKALFTFFCFFVPVLSNIIMPIIYFTAMGKDINVTKIIVPFVGIVMIIIGNYLPKCKQNSTIGIKLPWTLKSEENWNKTNHLGGWITMACGFAICLSALFESSVVTSVIMLIAILVMVLVITIYSFVLHKKGI